MNGCLGCGHAPHAGRCGESLNLKWRPPTNCPCKEETHGTDSPASGDTRGPAVPVAEPRRELARLGAELADDAEDILAQIRAIGRTMIEGAARMRGEGR